MDAEMRSDTAMGRRTRASIPQGEKEDAAHIIDPSRNRPLPQTTRSIPFTSCCSNSIVVRLFPKLPTRTKRYPSQETAHNKIRPFISAYRVILYLLLLSP